MAVVGLQTVQPGSDYQTKDYQTKDYQTMFKGCHLFELWYYTAIPAVCVKPIRGFEPTC